MNSSRGSTRDPLEILCIRFLDWLYAEVRPEGSTTDILSARRYIADRDRDVDPIQLPAVVSLLERNGLVEVFRSLGDGLDDGVCLTPDGVHEARVRRARREDRGARRRAVQEGLLSWLDDTTRPSGTVAYLERFLDDERSIFEGERVTFEEVSEAAQHLEDQGLCMCSRVAEKGPVAAMITTAGRARLDQQDGSTSPLMPPVGAYTDNRVTYNAPVQNAAAHSQHVNQYATQTMDIDKLLDFARSVGEALPALTRLSEEDRRRGRDLVEQIEAEAAGQNPDRTKLARLGGFLLGIIKTASSSYLVKMLTEKAPEGIDRLGDMLT